MVVFLKNSQELTDERAHEGVVTEDRDGFRLPTIMEWELAARYKGSDSSHGAIEHPSGSGNFWTPGNDASGATADYNNSAATQAVARYEKNSNVDGSGRKTQDVGKKPEHENGLGVFDMSGNVYEWCFTRRGKLRERRGGGWQHTAMNQQVGVIAPGLPSLDLNVNGFRFLRTHF